MEHFLPERVIENHRFGIADPVRRCPAQAGPWQVDLTPPYTRWSQEGVSLAQGTNSLKLLLLLLLLPPPQINIKIYIYMYVYMYIVV